MYPSWWTFRLGWGVRLRLRFREGVTKLFKTRTKSYFSVQIHAKGYQFNIQTFQIKICLICLHIMLPLIIKIKYIYQCEDTDHVYAVVRTDLRATHVVRAGDLLLAAPCWWPLVEIYYVTSMGAIRWGTRGTCFPHFFRRGGHNMPCLPTFFSTGFVFGEIPNIKVMFVTSCVKLNGRSHMAKLMLKHSLARYYWFC